MLVCVRVCLPIDHEVLSSSLNLALSPHTCGVYDTVSRGAPPDNGIHSIPSSPSNAAYNRTIQTKEAVEEGALADIRPTDEGDICSVFSSYAEDFGHVLVRHFIEEIAVRRKKKIKKKRVRYI